MSRLKDKEELNKLRESHVQNYGESNVIGKLRAHGRFRAHYNENLPGTAGPKPDYKGWCQAVGTGDGFRITIWKNENDFRFEIVEGESYASSTKIPF
jgi:hypothetical protein